MKRVARPGRMGVIAVVALLGLTACKDNGLKDRNLPLDEARHRQYSYPAYEATPSDVPVAAGGRAYMPSLPYESIPDGVLVPVSGATGEVLYAVRGSQAPYSRLYAEAGEGRWRPYLPLN